MKGRNQRYKRGSMEGMRPFSLFGPNIFCALFQFLEVAQVKKRCLRYRRGVLNSIKLFSFLVKKLFL